MRDAIDPLIFVLAAAAGCGAVLLFFMIGLAAVRQISGTCVP